MRTPTSAASRLAALAGVSAVVLTAGAFPAAAATSGSNDGVQVVNTETVQAYTDATGAVKSKRIYEQLALTGKGAVDLANPITTSGLRNLDGFGGFNVKGGDQMVDVKVDGEKNLRSVSDFKGKLPLEISIAYKLDGKQITPKSLVGKSGDLEVVYTVKNVTGRSQTISYTDGKGGTVEKQADVIVPMVGSLTVGLPSNFRDVKSGEANMAGDGEGGTKLSYTMTLLAPLGSDTATFGYTAKVTDAVAPGASVSALPVNPLESPSFKTAGDSYKGGAQTGEELAAGAAKIDSNLLKLRDGAGDLLAGLIKLRNGAQDLRDGLQNEAAPGAAKLADGAGQLKDGAGQLKAGTSELKAGTGTLTDGTGKLAAGSTELAAGAKKAQTQGGAKIAAGQAGLLEGLQELKRGVNGIDEAVGVKLDNSADYQTLLGTLTKIVGGIGSPSDMSPATLLGGLNLLQAGMTNPNALADCEVAKGDANPLNDCGAGQAAKYIGDQLRSGVTSINGGLLPAALGTYDYLRGYQLALSIPNPCPARPGPAALPPVTNLGAYGPTDACYIATVAAYGYGSPKIPGTPFAKGGLAVQAGDAADALDEINFKLTNVNFGDNISTAVEGILSLKKALYNTPCDTAQTDPTASDFCGISQALSLVKAGVPVLVDTVVNGIQSELLAGLGSASKGCDPTETLICAAAALAAGGADLNSGLGDLSNGAAQLRDGISQLDAGAGKLNDGAGQLDAGAGKLNDGAGQLADGSNKLADGLSAAAGGSGQLADGLVKAAGGAPQIVDGAGRLSTEGTSKLVEAGQETAQKYGEQYALLVAGAKRAQNEKMVVGAPADSIGLAAYSYEIKGENGEGSRNLLRGVAGLALLGAGGAVFALRRRLI